MNSRLWAAANDGLFQYAFLKRNKIESVMDLIRNNFFKHEKISVALGLPKHPKAVSELEKFAEKVVKEGATLIALEKATGRVAGCIMYKIMVKEDLPNNYLRFFESKNPFAKAFLQLLTDVDNTINPFEVLQTDCYIKHMFGSVWPEFGQRGILKNLAELSIEAAQALKNGEDPKISLDEQFLPLKSVPNAIMAVATTDASKKVYERLGYQLTAEIDLQKRNPLGDAISSRLPIASVMFKFLK